jgi:hypothetical protein
MSHEYWEVELKGNFVFLKLTEEHSRYVDSSDVTYWFDTLNSGIWKQKN